VSDIQLYATLTEKAACHTGHRSCFFRSVPLGARPSPELKLTVNDAGKVFDPNTVYGKTGGKPRF
jgi:phosphoribosyl-AMP cyclohydrolase